jgi:hypothetical protein
MTCITQRYAPGPGGGADCYLPAAFLMGNDLTVVGGLKGRSGNPSRATVFP